VVAVTNATHPRNCSNISSEAHVVGRLVRPLLGASAASSQILELAEASTAADLPVGAFYERAYGHGGLLPPSRGLSAQMAFRSDGEFSFREIGLALQLFLERSKSLIDIVVADANLHADRTQAFAKRI
jgi:hypothetical protein